MPSIKRTNEEWRALLAEQRASGLPQTEWCAANGVNLHTLRDRVSRLNKLDREMKPLPKPKRSKKPSAGWMQVKPEAVPKKTAIISIGYGGFTVTITPGFDTGLLTEALRVIKQICC